jgi:hypothetical protein
VAGQTSSREFPSPKMGGRSLGGRGSTGVSPAGSPQQQPQANPAAAGLSLPMADALGRDATPVLPPAPGSASPDADDEGPDDEAESGDLIRTDKKNNVFNRVKATLPVEASPKQKQSHLHLLSLASRVTIADPEHEPVEGTANGPSSSASPPAGIPPATAVSVLSALPTGITSTGTGNTPKPAFLRRLDSPETHHGQLIAAKARLQLLINRGLQVADKVKLSKVPEIKTSLEKALAKLEASLVPPPTIS